MRRSKKTSHGLLVTAAIALTAPAALAQQAPSTPPEPVAGTTNDPAPDIVVYGERRAVGESIQRVPLAVTAVAPATIQAANIVDVTDIGSLAPGARTAALGIVPSIPAFYIRGIGTDVSIRSLDPTVILIQDGMVIGYPAGSILQTFDLESVEVLRGPQGVLFGRNATGGAISLRTRRPADTFGAKLDVSYASFNEVNANASVEGPLGDNVRAKLAVLYRYDSGTTLNTNDGTFVPAAGNPTGARTTHPTGYVGGVNEFTIKPTVEFKPSDSTTLVLFTQYSRFNDDGAINRGIATPAGLAAVPATTLFGYTPAPSGTYAANIADTGYTRLRAGHVILEMTNKIGAGTLTTTAAYRAVSLNSTTNASGSPFPGFLGSPDTGLIFYQNEERNHQYSIESRYNTPVVNHVDLTLGFFYLHTNTNVLENRISQQTVAAPIYSRGQFSQDVDALAGYVNVDWTIVDRLKLSLGGRYSSDNKAITYAPIVNCPSSNLAACPQTFFSDSKRWNNFSPRAVLSWQATPRALFYASYTEGFRSGNYNPRTLITTRLVPPVDPEHVASYEIGSKVDFLDRRVRLNLALYNAIYRDIQQTVIRPGGLAVDQALLNVARARIRGAEAELTLRPFEGLTLNANGAYTDGKYTQFDVGISGVPDPLALKLPKLSKYTAYIAGTFTQPLPAMNAKLSLRLSYDWRSSFVVDFLNTPGLAEGAYGLTDGNLVFSKNNWSLAVFARNLFNVYYFDSRSRAFTFTEVGGRPRTIGVRGTINF